MKALSVRQPWAELIASGRKTIETRTWRTAYRGDLLICAGASWHATGARMHGRIGERGVCVCVVDIVDCRELTVVDSGAACFDVAATDNGRARYAWVFMRPRRVQATPTLGRLHLFEIDDAAISFSASSPAIAGPT